MNTLMLNVMANMNVLAQTTTLGKDLQKWLMSLIEPIFLVVVGVVALFFLFSQQFTKFMQFVVIAIVVGVLLFNPIVVKNIASSLAGAIK